MLAHALTHYYFLRELKYLKLYLSRILKNTKKMHQERQKIRYPLEDIVNLFYQWYIIERHS